MALETVEGEILHVNPAFCQMLGYTEDELRKMHCSQFSHPDDDAAEMVLFRELREGWRPTYQIDKRFRGKNGEWIWARVSISLLKTDADLPPLVVGIVEDIRERRQAEEHLKTTKLELERLAGRLLRAQEDERRRISLELHDDIGQRMTLMGMELEKLEQELRVESNPALAEQASAMKHRLEDLASSIHDMCRNLHSSKLELLGLRAALKELSHDIHEHSGMCVGVEVDEDANHLPQDVALCFYRVIQEALNNVSKHGKVTAAEVAAKRVGENIRVTIKDSGRGFDLARMRNFRGIGLASMRERLRAIDGTLIIRSRRGGGTEVTAEVRCASAHGPA
jgi:PAS domain S-box-containing protein